ncbi:hypothetical protein AAFF_G00229420 [Aldrovandia affinis]|uniref:Uncharacterized protein n=1 Tax=Aldrovandia affinis TaxID=143900 RepID=A0AAD7WU36_9TELE|nr:hypothetical protein AAFF_G00229420 [Aldrovandia affinis]
MTDPHPSWGDATGTCTSDPEGVTVRRWEITLDIPQEQMGFAISSYFQQFPTLSEWHSDTNNNTKTVLETCATDAFDAISKSPSEQAHPISDEPLDPLPREAACRSEDEGEEEEAFGPLWETMDRGPASSSGSEVENSVWDLEDAPSTLDHEPSWTSQDSILTEGICWGPGIPDEGELGRFQQQGGPNYEEANSQDPHTVNSLLPQHMDTHQGMFIIE